MGDGNTDPVSQLRSTISHIRSRGFDLGIKGSGSANLPAQVAQSILYV